MYEKGRKILERHGATNIESYVLVSNYGYRFSIQDKKHDVRFWANCYGCYIGSWSCSIKEIEDEFNELIGDGKEW